MTALHPTRVLTVLVAALSIAILTVPGMPATASPAGPAAAATGSDPVAVATGDRHSCVLTQEGRVWCWGANDRGQLGRDEPERSAAPVLVDGLRGVEQIAAGAAHTCAVAGEATWCWGANGSGQLGDGTTRDRLEPVRSLTGGITQLSAGRSHTCGVAAHGSHEVQSLAVSATGGSFRLGYGGSGTAAIAWNATGPAVEEALDALSPDWAVDVRAMAGPNGYAIEFGSGLLADQDVPQLTADGSGLRGADAAARVATVTDGGWRLLCWGADSASQLGRGPLEHADLVPDAVATDPASDDLYVADSAAHRVWRFGKDATFSPSPEVNFEPLALGVARIDGEAKVYVANRTEESPFDDAGAVARYDAATGEREGVYWAKRDTRVVPPTWTCHCQVTAMAVDPADGSVFIVVSGRADQSTPGQDPAPFAKLIRVDPTLSRASGDDPVDLVAEFPRVKAFTDLGVGADAAGEPVLYALQSPANAETDTWRMSVWDIGGDRLARRATFAVSPADRGAGDPSYDSACPARSVTPPRNEAGTWTRWVRTGVFDFGRIGPAGDGDVGVVTRYGYREQKQQFVETAQDPTGPPAEDDWEDVEPETVVEGLDACVTLFRAGSQGSYGRYRATLRGTQAGGSRLSAAPAGLAATSDGRILVADPDPDHMRIQQFTADGDPVGRWPGSGYSAVPTGSHALKRVLTDEGAEVREVSAGDAHTCVSTQAAQAVGPVLCWGADTAGQVGYRGGPAWIPARDPATTGSATGFPVIARDPAEEGQTVRAGLVSAGGAHTCTDDGREGPGTGTKCWGDDGLGQLGGSATAERPLVVTPSRPEQLAAGGSGTCLALQDGSVECWGPPVLQVEGLSGITSLDVGGRHACAIRPQEAGRGQVLCWGANDAGQTGSAGDGTARAVEVPLNPRVEASAPTALDAPIVVGFHDETSAVSASSFRLADADGRSVSVTVSCRGGSGAPVSCVGGAVRSADLSPSGGLVAGESYALTVSPQGDLESGGVPIAPIDFAVAGPRTLSSGQLGPAYTWATRADTSAYGGSVLTEETRRATLSYAFTGPRVTWYTRRGPGEGLATVLIDGVVRKQVDNSAARRSGKVPVRLTGLGPGPHTITIRVEGKRGIRARGRAVTVDAFHAGSLVRTPATSMAWGPAKVDARTVRRAASRGSAVSFRFRGSQIAWHTVAAANAGRADVLLDGVVVQRFDGYEDIAAPRPVTLVVPAGPGVHRISIVAAGKGRGTRHHAYVDAFEVSP